MPSLFANVTHGGHSLLHGHGLGHPASTSSSRPSSRAPSPTRTSSRSSIPTNIQIPRRGSTIDSTSTDPLSEFTLSSTPTSLNEPTYGPYSTTPEMWGSNTPGGSYLSGFHAPPVEVILDSDRLVLRGQGGDMNPAYLSGRIELNLPESTNIKEINMELQGKAKVQFAEGNGAGSKSHHYSHPVLHHDWSFLQGDKRMAHTLKAGHHSFPFSLLLNGNLPSTLTTYPGDGVISYTLRANVIRSGFASNYHAEKRFTLLKTFTPEALEFNQTLEIENTWPGKVMYSLTLPFKAYAAGDDIPVNVKFMPLAKGVKVLSVTSVIKEYSLVHTRHSQHPDSRVAASIKHELRNGRAVIAASEPQRPPLSWHYSQSSVHSRHPSRPSSPTRIPIPLQQTSAEGYLPPGESGPSVPTETDEDVSVGDDEVDTQFSIPVPAWTTPSHSIHPVFVTHKLKWSCAISNPDGHISELRCALPIIILDHSLLEEARTASAATRNLLFGGNGEQTAEQIDLPSYSNHVYDRVATADSGSTTGFLSRSASSAPLDSPHPSLTPPVSRPPSRPASPVRGLSRQSTRHEDDVPERRQLSSFVDDELLRSLGALQSHSGESSPNGAPSTPRGSRPPSRRGSVSRSGRSSRVGSRTSSPERSGASSVSGGDDRVAPPERRTSGFHGLLHLPASLKPMKPLTGSKPILRNTSALALGQQSGGEGIHRNAVSFTNLPDRAGSHRPTPRHRFTVGGGPPTPDEAEVDPLSQVPSYAIASRGFLGGGVVPLDSGPPTYDASERDPRSRRGSMSEGLARPRSDTALVALQGAVEAAAAEQRASEDGGEQTDA